jgi:hypothetical protein
MRFSKRLQNSYHPKHPGKWVYNEHMKHPAAQNGFNFSKGVPSENNNVTVTNFVE